MNRDSADRKIGFSAVQGRGQGRVDADGRAVVAVVVRVVVALLLAGVDGDAGSGRARSPCRSRFG